MKKSTKTIYTLGTDRRTEEDFIEILHAYEIRALIDVRRFPRSKIPIFNKEKLESLLAQEGIEYHFLGDELGGFRKGGYISYIITEDFNKGIEKVESIANSNITVIICAERFPWKCHRKWIAKELNRKGWKVEHILDKGKVWTPR